MSKLFFLSEKAPLGEGFFHDTASTEFCLETGKRREIIDLTDTVEKVMISAGFVGGLVHVQILHTTARLWLNEDEPLLHRDVIRLIEGMVPEGFKFGHDDFEIRTINVCEGECANGDSHFQAALFAESVLLQATPGEDGLARLNLGRWGRILMVELDGPRKERKISVMMTGTFKNGV